MNATPKNRLISLLLAFALVIGFAAPAAAADNADHVVDLQFEKTDQAPVSLNSDALVTEPDTPASVYADTDDVRVSIFLDQAATLDAGYSTMGISENVSAMSYRDRLHDAQQQVQADIEQVIGGDLEVFWNLTLAANVISANVPFGDIPAIEELDGVEKVMLETRYEPQAAEVATQLEPNMVVSAQMTGTGIAWKSGYSGAGSRIAVIDTGIDPNHQSVDNDAFLHALRQNAAEEGSGYEEYVESLDLLDRDEIARKLDQLNMVDAWNSNPKNTEPLTADLLFRTEKLPLGFCYVDKGLGITHEYDTSSEHGSHVAGIAAANRYIENDDGTFSDAAETVHLVGNAPDAQILVMKVFGIEGGAYDSDYLAAIEDAILLDCDAVNLSLGSASPGLAVYPNGYGRVLDTMKDSDTVVSISMGNSGAWGSNAKTPAHLTYADHTNFFTGGSPGSYASPLTVGSVDNDGSVGHFFRAAGSPYQFTETPVSSSALPRRAFLSLDKSKDGSGTSYGYVFLDSVGKPADFEGIDVTGKIVFLPRGKISFADKATNAVAAGAAGVVIYNNAPGALNMNLDSYRKFPPVVSILKADADKIRAASTEARTDAGVVYYTGDFHIDHSITPVYRNSDYYNMSSFSSWGAPGDLSLKPDLVAPGGKIYSMNGTHKKPGGKLDGGPDSYELMSGTSMAAPQISGISALVIQSIEERGISAPDLTNRALAQALMMSTARPMVDSSGAYYPLLQQGAGVIDTAAAVSADSYITVSGQDDGKVKAELGDDPSRSGSYTFSFTLNNVDNTARTYQLSADVFGQAAVTDNAGQDSAAGKAVYTANHTTPFSASAVFTVNGREIRPSDSTLEHCDFNGDGIVNLADGQALMNYVTGLETELSSREAADLNGDGTVSTYDVHLFLSRLSSVSGVEVPANGSTEVTVTVSLTGETKQQLDRSFPSGAYIYAYIHAAPDATAEGEIGTAHSIPMLAYYGRWSDHAMFDVGSYQAYAHETEKRDPYFGNRKSNSFTVSYGDRPDNRFYFGGNPLVPDPVYLPERNAVNIERGDRISQLVLSPIRNGADSRLVISKNGEPVKTESTGQIPGAFFSLHRDSWINARQALSLDWNPADAGLAEGDRFDLTFEMATEYDMNPDLSVRWNELGHGGRLTVSGTVDNTAPVIENVRHDLQNNCLIVTVSDNQFVSAVQLVSPTGSKPLAVTGSNPEAQAGETHSFILDLSGVNGQKFRIQAADYAANVTSCEVELQPAGENVPEPSATEVPRQDDPAADTEPTEAESAAAPEGSLNAVASAPDVQDNDLITVTITADNATTNGLITVEYDAEQLSFADGGSRAQLHALAAEDGKLRLGYAFADAADAGTELLTLQFRRLSQASSEITVTVTEENDRRPNRSETVTVRDTSLSGWVSSEDGWRYYDENGQSLTGWQYLAGSWYYLGTDGLMTTGWQYIAGSWYYFNTYGHMTTGWQYIAGSWYYLNIHGHMVTGWQYIAGSWYYFNTYGHMMTGWQYIAGSWYYLSADGRMMTGWQQIAGSWYYLSADGRMMTGWQYITGSWFYFSADGHMMTGWQYITGSWFYFRADGPMVTGWQRITGSWFYFYSSGIMAHDTTVDGCRLDRSGVMIG